MIYQNNSQVLRFHSTAAAFFTLSWSREHTHCHQLIHLYTKLLSVRSRTHIQHTEKRTAAVLAPQQRNLFPVLSPRCSSRGALVCWNTRPAACSAALPSPHPVASSAQMLWQRPRGGPAGCDSKITITSSAKNNKPTGICFGVTDAQTYQHGAECKHAVEGQHDLRTDAKSYQGNQNMWMHVNSVNR